MRTPVSWIREYADLPTDLPTEDLARTLTALGLKLEAIERPGADIRGPLVVGRVLTLEPEPQKNGKTINWCTVDVGDANGTGEPQLLPVVDLADDPEPLVPDGVGGVAQVGAQLGVLERPPGGGREGRHADEGPAHPGSPFEAERSEHSNGMFTGRPPRWSPGSRPGA